MPQHRAGGASPIPAPIVLLPLHPGGRETDREVWNYPG